MKNKRLLLVPTLLCSAILLTNSALANHGRYLPDIPRPRNVTEGTYGGNLTEFTQDVICDKWGKIGEIRFTYDTWTGDYDPPTEGWDTGGAILVGGFFGDCPVKLKSGYEWEWIQIVTANRSGNNYWGAPDGTPFPDSIKEDPRYTGNNVNTTPAPTIGFNDCPNRIPGLDRYWQAELGLVCMSTAEKKVCIAGTFFWGFDVEDDPAAITPRFPYAWGDPSPSYMSTLRECFDGDPGTAWTFCDTCCCCVPEPGTFVLLFGLGAFVLFLRKRKTL